MNVGELIEALSKHPKDTPVCVDNNPIYYVERIPAYWDGRLGKLIQDQSLKCYNIIGWEYTDQGEKVRLCTMEIDDVLLNDPDLPVEYELGDNTKETYFKRVERLRKEIKEIKKEYDKGER